MDLEKIAARLDPFTNEGVTSVTGVTDRLASLVTTTYAVTPVLHSDESRCNTAESVPCYTALHSGAATGVTSQHIDSVGVNGFVTPVTPVIPAYMEGPHVFADFSGVTGASPVVITEARQLDGVLPALCAAPLVGVDTETTGLDPLTDRLRLVQCAVLGGPVVAVDVWQVPVQLLEPIFTARHVLAFHNAKFDLKMLAASGLAWPTARLFDTQVAAQLLGAGTEAGRLRACGLATLAERWLGVEVDKSL